MSLPHDPSQGNNRTYFYLLSLGALGVVFGDIGTSPLYSLRECFNGHVPLALTEANIFGVLSLVFWALISVISVKYCLYVMRADNRGEGGVLALMALAHPSPKMEGGDSKRWLIFLGLLGASLLYGDGVITPAISVLSAVEGLEEAAPSLKPYVVYAAVAVLFVLFLPQRFGTDKIGKAFGPIILVWFFALGILGLRGIALNTHILNALNPYYALRFFVENGGRGFFVLGSVFLVVTGGEALYADIGHFGRKPINFAWFLVVLPSLVLNYLGQGALVLKDPGAIANPFYRLVPDWALYPMIGLSTVAAVIASQALISGTYSMTQQAIQLGYLPRQRINYTSKHQMGQIYLPQINWIMLMATVALVVIFRSSSNLAAAYGLAVTATMLVTTILTYYVARELWRWPVWAAGFLTLFFVCVESSFLVSNLLKFLEGGWIPVLIASFIFASMTTWRRGRYILSDRLREKAVPTADFLAEADRRNAVRIPGVAVFMTSVPESTPPSLIHNFRHNQILHSHTVLLTVTTETIPYVAPEDHFEVSILHPGVYFVKMHYGFMEMPNVPESLQLALKEHFSFEPRDVTYFLGRESLMATDRPGMAIWREKYFAYMAKNSQKATDFFQLPTDQVFEIGIVIEL